jgi:hypothetical protein
VTGADIPNVIPASNEDNSNPLLTAPTVMPPSPCINPNPDISGIGVRVSIYTQAFLSLVPLMLFAVDGKITRSERKALDTIYANILVTACALLISAFVQAATFGLTVYHTLIVLNLSWINSAGAVAWSYIDFLDGGDGKENRKIWARLPFPFSNGLPSTLACAHLSAMAGLGIWVWSKVATFGDQPECTPETLMILFGHDIPVTNKPLYIALIVVYSITAIPGINLILLVTLVILVLTLVLLVLTVLLMKIVRGWHPSSFARRLGYIGGPLLGALLDLLFVINTELMIRSNKGLVKEAESQWTFGQTLAMLMVVLPLVEVTKQVISWYRGDPEDKVTSSADQEIKPLGKNLDVSEPSPLTV